MGGFILEDPYFTSAASDQPGGSILLRRLTIHQVDLDGVDSQVTVKCQNGTLFRFSCVLDTEDDSGPMYFVPHVDDFNYDSHVQIKEGDCVDVSIGNRYGDWRAECITVHPPNNSR